MNFYNIVQNILNTSSRHKNVKEVSEGDIYVYLNSGEHKYPCVFLTVGEVTDSEMSRNVNCTLFYVDRLVSDQSNRTAVQSLGITTLGDILDTIEGDVISVNYTTFTEKFTDLCAGVFATVDITYPMDEICDEHFDVRRLEVTENGIYDTIGYDEFVVNIQSTLKIPNGMKMGYTSILPEILDTSDVTSFASMFRGSSLTTIPLINTSNGTNFSGMFHSCSNLTNIPQIDTSKGTDFSTMFYNCNNLTEIPQIDTSKGTDFSGMFHSCSNLTNIPQIDTSKGTDFSTMFYNCNILTEIPQIDTSKGTDFSFMFQYCYNLTEIPQIDTSNGTNFQQMFYNCNNLVTIPLLDLSNKEPVNYNGSDGEFTYCNNLENITFVGNINSNISFTACTKLTYESVKSILTACSKTTQTTRNKTLSFKQTLTDQNGELVALVADCNSKKWTISGLTLK